MHSCSDDGHRIGLLAAGAAGNPDADGIVVRLVRQQFGQDLVLQRLKRLRVAEEIGHPDQQFLEQDVRLALAFLQVAHVVRDVVDLVDVHPPLDPAADGVLLVEREIVVGPGAKDDEDLLQAPGDRPLDRRAILGPVF